MSPLKNTAEIGLSQAVLEEKAEFLILPEGTLSLLIRHHFSFLATKMQADFSILAPCRLFTADVVMNNSPAADDINL